MTIRLIHVDQLETLYLCYWVKWQSGVIWDTGATVFRSVYRSSSFFLITLPAQPQGIVSYSFLLKLGGFRLTYWDLDVSSFFLSSFSQSASSSKCLIGSLPNSVRSMYGYMATKLMGLKIHPGSFGVTGVKNVNHMKNMKTAPIQNLIMSSCRQ